MFKENKSNRVVFQQCDYHTSSCRVHDIKSFMLIDLNYFFLARENILARQIPLQAKHNDDIIDKKSWKNSFYFDEIWKKICSRIT